jgi:hypothetical protein
MKKAFEQFSRIIALVLLVTVTFMSCPANPPEEPLKITPGVEPPALSTLIQKVMFLKPNQMGRAEPVWL